VEFLQFRENLDCLERASLWAPHEIIHKYGSQMSERAIVHDILLPCAQNTIKAETPDVLANCDEERLKIGEARDGHELGDTRLVAGKIQSGEPIDRRRWTLAKVNDLRQAVGVIEVDGLEQAADRLQKPGAGEGLADSEVI
jgi:hypothetical protein